LCIHTRICAVFVTDDKSELAAKLSKRKAKTDLAEEKEIAVESPSSSGQGQKTAGVVSEACSRTATAPSSWTDVGRPPPPSPKKKPSPAPGPKHGNKVADVHDKLPTPGTKQPSSPPQAIASPMSPTNPPFAHKNTRPTQQAEFPRRDQAVDATKSASRPLKLTVSDCGCQTSPLMGRSPSSSGSPSPPMVTVTVLLIPFDSFDHILISEFINMS